VTAASATTAPLKNPKHERFCQLRAEGKSQDTAYAEVGYRPNSSHAARLEARPEVKARISALMAPAAEQAGATAERTLTELTRIGYGDPRRLFHEDGRLKAIHDLDDETAAMVSSFEITAGQVTKVKLWPKVPALAELVRIQKLIGAGALPNDADGPVPVHDPETHRILLQIAESIGPGAVENLERRTPKPNGGVH